MGVGGPTGAPSSELGPPPAAPGETSDQAAVAELWSPLRGQRLFPLRVLGTLAAVLAPGNASPPATKREETIRIRNGEEA